MVLQKLNRALSFGRKKIRDYPPGGIQYYITRVASITGYRKADVESVLKCLANVFDECLVEVTEDGNKGFNFGPIEIYSKNLTRDDYWKNPKTGEIVKRVPRVVPAVRLRPRWKETFSTSQIKRREELKIDINGQHL